MKLVRTHAAAIAALALLSTTHASADEIVYSGSGTITFAEDIAGDFEVGQVFEFIITIDSDEISADSDPSANSGIFAFPMGYSYQLIVPDASFDMDLGGNSISTFNDAGSSAIDSVAFNGNSVIMNLRDNSGSVFSTDALPTTLPGIGAFDEPTFSYFPPGSLQNFGGTVTDINVSTFNTCPADLAPPGAPDGVINFFDVSEFITLYTINDPAADINRDSIVNFFDVSSFLAAYNSGCP